MWFLPILVISAIVVAVSRSPRDSGPPQQFALAAPPPPPPGPISVLGEYIRVGHFPPPTVILCAIAEAESVGRDDIASDIIRMFVAPIVHQYEMENVQHVAPPIVYAPVPVPMPAYSPSPVYAPAYAAPAYAPAYAPPPPVARVRYERGSCAAPRSRSPREAVPSPPVVHRPPPPPLALGPGRVPSTDDEIRAMLSADPERFIAMVTRGPVIEVPREAVKRAAARSIEVLPPPPAPLKADTLADQLLGLPGYASSGVVQTAPGNEIFEVRWLRGYPVPSLPQRIDGRPVRVIVVDALPVALVPETTASVPTGLPSETVAQMQEAAGLHEAADQTRSLAPGSPIHGVTDDDWRTFVMRLEREPPTFNSSRHVGQYRQSRSRLVELDIDPAAILNSAQAQRTALDVDLADAHHHATEGGLLSEHLGRPAMIPEHDAPEMITLSGVLGVIQCAGLDNATNWLERYDDRKRYPNTTQAFLRTNGVF